MKKITAILSLVLLFAVMSVQAQLKTGVKPAPQPKPIEPAPQPVQQFDNLISVEDNATGRYIVFSPLSGEYKFFGCSDGTELSGIGKVKISGCSIFLEDLQPSQRVLISVNQCDQEGKASIERFAVKDNPFAVVEIKAYFSDSNMRDNTQSCVPKK